ncbi:unnamed protein product [Danaus chrysippus]|uniref:(African queen) hypothetical protein n=1 Tax=Danaus chrysippus TaxID=151541 RepID=A0A8J2VR83_9NEOP|nr:unnamed protein product [Danaus chrysippus]
MDLLRVAPPFLPGAVSVKENCNLKDAPPPDGSSLIDMEHVEAGGVSDTRCHGRSIIREGDKDFVSARRGRTTRAFR